MENSRCSSRADTLDTLLLGNGSWVTLLYGTVAFNSLSVSVLPLCLIWIDPFVSMQAYVALLLNLSIKEKRLLKCKHC